MASKIRKWDFVLKIVLIYCEKKCSSDQEKLLRIWGWRPRVLRSLEQRIWTANSQNVFDTESFLACYLCCSDLIQCSGTIKMPIRTNNWDVETYMNKLEKSFLTIWRIVKESLRFFAKYGKTELIVEVFYVWFFNGKLFLLRLCSLEVLALTAL